MDTSKQGDVGAALPSDEAIPPRYRQIAGQLAAWRLPAWLVELGRTMRAVERGARTPQQMAAHAGDEAYDAAQALLELAGPPPRPALQPVEPTWRLFCAVHRSPAAGLLKLTELLMQLRHTPAVDLTTTPETIAAAAHAATRLGMWSVRSDLRDIAADLADPHLAAQGRALLDRSEPARTAFFDALSQQLGALFEREGISARIERRPRRLAQVVEDGLESARTSSPEPDRIVVLCGSVSDCYRVLGAINSAHRAVGTRLRDYISGPKDNGYQAIQTVIEFSAGDRRTQHVPIHIATEAMLRFNRAGLLAWLAGTPPPLDRPVWWADRRRWLEAYRGQSDEIFVFTPRAEPIYLPRGATVLDFAVRVHQDLGVFCRGALVNAHRVAPGEHLECGDLCEVLIDPHGAPVDQRLLDVAVTKLAKSRIRRAIQTGRDGAARGRLVFGKLLAERLEEAGLQVGQQTVDQQLAELCRRRGYQSVDALYRGVARGEVAPEQLTRAVVEQLLLPRLDVSAVPPDVLASAGRLRLALCCRPHPPQAVVGVMVRAGHLLRVHAEGCERIAGLTRYPLRWREAEPRAYAAEALYEGWDRAGLISQLTSAVAAVGGINIRELHADVPEPRLARIRFSFEAPAAEQIEQVRKALERLPERRHVELRAVTLVDDGLRLMMPLDNPYGPQPVGSWPVFLGRDAEVRAVTTQLGGGSGVRHVLVCGPKRIGKSSLLDHLSRYHLNDFTAPALLNLQGLATDDLRFPRLVARLAAMLAQKAGTPAPPLDPGAAAGDPIAAFGAFLEQARGRAGERFVLLIDELGVVAGRLPPEQAREFFDQWRAMLNDARVYRHLAFVVAMPDAALGHLAGASSQIGELGAVVRLGVLGERDARDLISAPVRGHLEYEPELLDRLVAETGGHPYYIHLVCSQVVGMALARRQLGRLAPDERQAAPALVEAALRAVLANADVFHHVLADSSPETRAVLLGLAGGSRDAPQGLSRPRLLRRLRGGGPGFTQGSITRALDERPDLIEERDETVGFRAGLVGRWLQRQQ